MTNPVLIEVTRGAVVESWHRGAIAICGAAGDLEAAVGDVERVMYPRSALKPIQALPLIASGAADAIRLSDAEIALACGSHSGEQRHTETVSAWLERIGCSEDDLACGPHAPMHGETAADLAQRGLAPGGLHNNCSGKHAGFLTSARHGGSPVAGYTALEHPVQQRVRVTLARLAGLPPDRLVAGVDGCSAPNFALPLIALARAGARLADSASLEEPQASAAARICHAMRAYPFMVAGTGRFCTAAMPLARGGTVIKAGAEGVFLAMVPAFGLGIALKIDDGAGRAAQVVMAHLLVRLGLLDAQDRRASALLRPPLHNWRGDIVGTVRLAAGWIEHIAPRYGTLIT